MESLQFLLDTRIVSHLVRYPQGVVRDRIAEVGEETVCVSLLVAAELRFGAARKQSARLTQQVEAVLSVLPILALEPDLDRYFKENVIGGPGAFVIAAKDFETFGEAILKKLIAEIANVPPESSAPHASYAAR